MPRVGLAGREAAVAADAEDVDRAARARARPMDASAGSSGSTSRPGFGLTQMPSLTGCAGEAFVVSGRPVIGSIAQKCAPPMIPFGSSLQARLGKAAAALVGHDEELAVGRDVRLVGDGDVVRVVDGVDVVRRDPDDRHPPVEHVADVDDHRVVADVGGVGGLAVLREVEVVRAPGAGPPDRDAGERDARRRARGARQAAALDEAVRVPHLPVAQVDDVDRAVAAGVHHRDPLAARVDLGVVRAAAREIRDAPDEVGREPRRRGIEGRGGGRRCRRRPRCAARGRRTSWASPRRDRRR